MSSSVAYSVAALLVCVMYTSAEQQMHSKSPLEVEADFIEAEAKKHGLSVVSQLTQAAQQGSQVLKEMQEAGALRGTDKKQAKDVARESSKQALVALRLAEAQGAKVIEEIDAAIAVALQREAAEAANKQPPTKRTHTEQVQLKESDLDNSVDTSSTKNISSVKNYMKYAHHCKFLMGAAGVLMLVGLLIMLMRRRQTHVSVVMLEDQYKVASGSETQI